MLTTTVETIAKQIEAARWNFGVRTGKNPRFGFVQMNDVTLKVNRGTQGVMIRYDAGQDLYALTYYAGMEIGEEIEGVYFDQFEELVVEKLTKKIRF